MWLSQEGPYSSKHTGWCHPIAVFLVQYTVVGVATITIHDFLFFRNTYYHHHHHHHHEKISTSTISLGNDVLLLCTSSSSKDLIYLMQRQQNVAFFLVVYYCCYFTWRLMLQWNTPIFFAEFYRQTFLCSVTILISAIGLYMNRPIIAEAFCISVGIDQLLW
jgi:hypothetical protein